MHRRLQIHNCMLLRFLPHLKTKVPQVIASMSCLGFCLILKLKRILRSYFCYGHDKHLQNLFSKYVNQIYKLDFNLLNKTELFLQVFFPSSSFLMTINMQTYLHYAWDCVPCHHYKKLLTSNLQRIGLGNSIQRQTVRPYLLYSFVQLVPG